MEKAKPNQTDIFAESSEGLFEGDTMKIRGREIVVPALSLGWIEDNAKLLEKLSMMDEKKPLAQADVVNIIKVAQAALSRNYPNITTVNLRPLIDLRNFRQLFALIMGASGFVQQDTGAETETGE